MSNSSSILAYSLTTLVGLGGILQGAEEDTAALTRRIERLEKQNAALKASYVQARSDADKAAAQLVDIRTRLEALGGAALGNSEERLIQRWQTSKPPMTAFSGWSRRPSSSPEPSSPT